MCCCTSTIPQSLIYSFPFSSDNAWKRFSCEGGALWCLICFERQLSDLFPSISPSSKHRKSTEGSELGVNQSLITRNIKSSGMFDMQLKLNCKQILNPRVSHRTITCFACVEISPANKKCLNQRIGEQHAEIKNETAADRRKNRRAKRAIEMKNWMKVPKVE